MCLYRKICQSYRKPKLTQDLCEAIFMVPATAEGLYVCYGSKKNRLPGGKIATGCADQ